MANESRKKSKRGLPSRFVSRQTQTLKSSGERLDARLEELQRESARLAHERAELERQRASSAEDPGPPVELVELTRLRLDAQMQSRELIHPRVVTEYIERMEWSESAGEVTDPEGKPWPPLHVYHDGEVYWVADGFHRFRAALEVELERFQCRVSQGTERDALRHSLSANARHGLRRTREDKRRSVRRALEDSTWRTWTDARLARLCSVSRSFVSAVRDELERDELIPTEVALYSEDGREYERDLEALAQARRPDPHPAAPEAPAAPPEVGVPSPAKPTPDAPEAVAHLEWSQLSSDALGDHELVVIYPNVEGHYTRVVELLCAQEHPVQALLCPAMEGTEWFWRGPSLLDGLTDEGFDQPRLVELEDLRKRFVVWARTSTSMPEAPRDTGALLDTLGAPLLVGTALDSWEGAP